MVLSCFAAMEIVQLRLGHLYNVFAVVIYILVAGSRALSPDGRFCFCIVTIVNTLFPHHGPCSAKVYMPTVRTKDLGF